MKFYKFLLLLFIYSCCNSKNHHQNVIPDYKPFSRAIIEINRQYSTEDRITVQVLANTVIPGTGTRSRELKMLEDGKYLLIIEIDRTSKATLRVNENEYNIIISPDDTTIIKLDDEIRFDGKYESISQYYLNKKKHFGYVDSREPLNKLVKPTSTYNAIKAQTDSIINSELDFLANYSKSNQLPAWFPSYEKAELLYLGAGFKITKPDYNSRRRKFKDQVPHDYFNFLQEIRIDNPDAYLSTNYFVFLNYYFLLDFDQNELAEISSYQARIKAQKHILYRSKHELYSMIRELYLEKKFVEELRFYADITDIDSLAEEYQLTRYNHLLDQAGTNIKARIHPLNLSPGDVYPDFELINQLDETNKFNEAMNNNVVVKFWATWCKPCLADFPRFNDLFLEANEGYQIVNICINSQKEDWIKSLVKYKVQGKCFFANKQQSNEMRTIFNINGVPHYSIIGKGNIYIDGSFGKIEDLQTGISRILKE